MSESKNFLVGFFHVEGIGSVTAETPLTGAGAADYAQLWANLRKEFGEGRAEKLGTTIEQRTEGERVVEYPAGGTVQQLFLGLNDQCAIQIGRVEFSGQECDVILRYHRGRNMAGLMLTERASKAPTRFSDHIPGLKLASELPKLIREICGESKLNLWLKEIPADV